MLLQDGFPVRVEEAAADFVPLPVIHAFKTGIAEHNENRLSFGPKIADFYPVPALVVGGFVAGNAVGLQHRPAVRAEKADLHLVAALVKGRLPSRIAVDIGSRLALRAEVRNPDFVSVPVVFGLPAGIAFPAENRLAVRPPVAGPDPVSPRVIGGIPSGIAVRAQHRLALRAEVIHTGLITVSVIAAAIAGIAADTQNRFALRAEITDHDRIPLLIKFRFLGGIAFRTENRLTLRAETADPYPVSPVVIPGLPYRIPLFIQKQSALGVTAGPSKLVVVFILIYRNRSVRFVRDRLSLRVQDMQLGTVAAAVIQICPSRFAAALSDHLVVFRFSRVSALRCSKAEPVQSSDPALLIPFIADPADPVRIRGKMVIRVRAVADLLRKPGSIVYHEISNDFTFVVFALPVARNRAGAVRRQRRRRGEHIALLRLRVPHQVDGVRADIMQFAGQMSVFAVLADAGQLFPRVFIFRFRKGTRAARVLPRNKSSRGILNPQFADFSAAGNQCDMGVHALQIRFFQLPESLRSAVYLGIIRIVRRFHPEIVPAYPAAGKQNERQPRGDQAMSSSAPPVVAFQFLALDAQHGRNDAQEGTARPVVIDADARDVLFPAQLRQVGGEALLRRVSALVHDEGNDAAEIAAALQEIAQLIVQIPGILRRFPGADHDQVPGRLHLFREAAVQQARRQIGLVQEDRAAAFLYMGMLSLRSDRQAVALKIPLEPARPFFVRALIADKGKIGIGVLCRCSGRVYVCPVHGFPFSCCCVLSRSGITDSRAEQKDIGRDQNDGCCRQKPVWSGGKRIEEAALLWRQDIHNAREYEAPEEGNPHACPPDSS